MSLDMLPNLSKITESLISMIKNGNIMAHVPPVFHLSQQVGCFQFLLLRQAIFVTILSFFFLFALGIGICQAGFEGPGSPTLVNTVKAALEAPDDAPCVLLGKIEAKMPNRKNRYLFADQTGKIVVEIKKKVFGSLTITPQNIVRLVGEVDWDSKHENEVEVDSLTIVQ